MRHTVRHRWAHACDFHSLIIILLCWILPFSASAQFNPAVGPINDTIQFSAATSASSGPYSLTRSGLSFTVSRPGLVDFTFTAPGLLGASTEQAAHAFIGSDGLLIRSSSSTNIENRTTIVFKRLDTTDPVETLVNHQAFLSDQPNVQIRRSSDSLVLFTLTAHADSAINDTFDIALFRGDTGRHLCGMIPFNRDPGDQTSAEVLGSGGNATGLRITRTRPNFPNVTQDCALPQALFEITPQSIDFGEVANNQSPQLQVTLSNPGGPADDAIEVSAVATTAHCTPIGFTPQTLAPGDSVPLSIQLNPQNPPGQVASINEDIAITRNPAVGPAAINCQAESRDPVPVLSLSTNSLVFGQVNVGAAATRSLILSNTGEIDLTFQPVTGPTLAEFNLAPAGPIAAIPAGQSTTLTVSFTPSAAQVFNDSITFTTNDPASPTQPVSLTGTGHIPQPQFVMDPALNRFDYGEVEQGYRFGKGIRIRNPGDADLTFTVDVAGDGRFSFSDQPNQPGVGQQNLLPVTIPPMGERTFRVTFDARAPDGGPYNGTFDITSINDTNVPPTRTVDLEGSVIPGKTLDVALILDRSGSMNEPTADGSKAQTLRRASSLFLQLLRESAGDRVAIVGYNTQASLLEPLTQIDAQSRADLIDTVTNSTDLNPSGATSIAAGLLEGFGQLTDAGRDVRAALIVSDGKENTPAQTPGGPVDLNTIALPAGVGVHSLALGRQQDVDTARLTDIANRSGGTSQYTGDLTGLNVFDIEKFFLQVATTLLGQQPVLDPVYTIAPGQTFETPIPLIPADKEVTIALMFKQGVLPYTVIAPDGTAYPTASPPNGFGQSVEELPTARLFKLKLPTDEPQRYQGVWKLRVAHQGFVWVGDAKKRVQEQTGTPVSYAVAVAAGSNLRMFAFVSPQPAYPGDRIGLNASLAEEGAPVPGAAVEAIPTLPNGAAGTPVILHDDGMHNDGEAGDGEYGGEFTHTLQAGGYSFLFRASGSSARGGQFIREQVLGKTVLAHPDFTGTDPQGRDCCTPTLRLLRIIIVLLVIAVLLMLGRFWWSRQMRSAGQ
ncbi:Ig-like domain-containing protein [Thiohalobacter thiocyanaticus]|nr:choice-of-anchor D domain-containing protein [Thiohalobacter thiocyanaticus]